MLTLTSFLFPLLFLLLSLLPLLHGKISEKNSSLLPRKSTRNKGKGKASSPVTVDSDFFAKYSSDSSLKAFERQSGEGDNCLDSKKKFKFKLESFLDGKVDFWGPSNESFFITLKDKTLVHGRVVNLDLISALQCRIKELF